MVFKPLGECELDSRKRLPLAKFNLNLDPTMRYQVSQGPNGELRFVPLVSLTKAELELLNDLEKMKRINENLDAAASGDVVPFDPDAAIKRLNTLRISTIK